MPLNTHEDCPIDRLTLDAASLDDVSTPGTWCSMVNSSSAGWYYAVHDPDSFSGHTKNCEYVILHARRVAQDLMNFTGKCEGYEQLEQYIRDRDDVFATRILERRACAENLKRRTVYDTAYASNYNDLTATSR